MNRLIVYNEAPTNSAEKDSPSYYYENLSAEKDVDKKKPSIEITIHKDNESISRDIDTYGLTNVLSKAKSLYTTSWEDVQTYIQSLSVPSAEELKDDTSYYREMKGDHTDSEVMMKKKWVIYDMTRLAFEEDQIEDAVYYLDILPEHLTREEMLKMIIEYLVEKRRTINNLDFEDRILDDGQKRHNQDRQDFDSVFDTATSKKTSAPKSLSIRRKYFTNMDGSSKQLRICVQEGRQEEVDGLQNNEEQNGSSLCSICYNYLPESQLQSTLVCRHAFCSDCQRQHIEEYINTNRILSIPCPSVKCAEKFEDQHVAKFVSSENLERYQRFKRNMILNQNPNLKWCIRPGCDKYIIEKEGSKKVICECGTKMCFRCGNQYHFGKSCENVIDKIYQKYAKEKNVQACPQCKSRIEKTGGCEHMTCMVCKYEWCWLCGIKYDKEHFLLDNPDRCRKMPIDPNASEQIQLRDLNERNTYCSRSIQEPILFLAFPLFLIFSSVMMPNWLYNQYEKKKLGARYNENSESSERLFFLSLIGFVLSPISAAVLLGLILCDALVDVFLWIVRRIKGADAVQNPKMLQPLIL